ncbi:MAG: hypothetical protein KF901_21440 [Myxococcales bacterium]|nr:hypothetical protein [Myxococcales bacterium]
MSRAYRISVSESVRRTVREEDGVCAELDLLPILAPERMSELLAAELERLGFRREGSCARRVQEDGVEIEIDLERGVVHVRVAGDQEVAVDVTREVLVDADTPAARARASAAVRRDLEGHVERRAEQLRVELSERLERRLADLRAELDRAVVRTTQEALKERAAQLGEVREISEDPETGSLTIRVKL